MMPCSGTNRAVDAGDDEAFRVAGDRLALRALADALLVRTRQQRDEAGACSPAGR